MPQLTSTALAGVKGASRPLMLLHRARATMAAFLTSMQAYVMIEVLEAQWASFAQSVDACPNLDELIGELA